MTKFLSSFWIFICFLGFAHGQTLLISVQGSNDVCGDTVIALVVNPQPGYFYSWNKRSSACGGGSVTSYGIGDTIQVTNTGIYFCTGLGSSGIPEFSNDIQVRVLPMQINSQSLLSPYPFGPAACGPSLLMCIPEELYDSLVTLIRWYKDGVEIIGADSSTFLANVNGTYKYSIKSYCSQTFSDTVQLITQPVVPVVTSSGVSPVCSGSVVNASVNNVQPGATYIWEANVSSGAWIIVGTGTTLNYTVPSGTSLSIRSLMMTPCIVISNSITFQVDDIQPLISPSLTVALCSGGSVNLNASSTLPASYQWFQNNVPVPGATFASLLTTVTGNYSITASAACGTVTSDSVVVFADPLTSPAITASGTTNICAGSSVTLSAVTGPGYTYQWKKYGNLIIGATGSTHNATSAGIYRSLITSGNGCLKSSNSISVNILPLPNASITATGPTTFCSGDSVLLNAANATGYTYQWRKGLVVIPGASSPNYTAINSGNYRVRITGPNGCYKSSNIITVNVPCRVGNYNELKNETSVKIYPNPSTNKFHLQIEGALIEPIKLTGFDISGKEIPVTVERLDDISFDISFQEAGLYLLIIKSGDFYKSIKVLKTL